VHRRPRANHGAAKGSALIVWGGPWSLDGELATERISLQELMAVFTRDAKSTGQLESRLRYSMSSQALATMFDSPKVDGSFDIKKGDLDGVDLVRALQSGGRGVTQGGATRFEEEIGTIRSGSIPDRALSRSYQPESSLSERTPSCASRLRTSSASERKYAITISGLP